MDKDDLAYLLALDRCPGVGALRYQQLLQLCEFQVSQLFEPDAGRQFDLTDKERRYLRNPDWTQVEAALEWAAAEKDNHILSLAHPDYPRLLTEIADSPPILYLKGRVELLAMPQIAIVGSRNCSASGADTAFQFARYLGQSGLTITSGLAQGIDRNAHLGALEAVAGTVAVIGTGIDRVYPAVNRQLALRIAQQGLIVSEFALGTPPASHNFPRRNRIISGLSIGVLVVEATRNSGSLITARCALEQGREVFAIPGSIHSPQAKGCHQLIREGAKLVDQASDITDDIASLLGFVADQPEAPTEATDSLLQDPDYRQLLEVVGYDPVSMDTLLARSGLTVEQLSSMLLLLELNDHIKPAPGGLYIRC
jgi:DNA processing protein